jgi:hypothetical protein
MNLVRTFLLVSIICLSACSTTQEVTLAESRLEGKIATVAIVHQEGNSAAMDRNLLAALQKQGLVVRSNLPKASEEDLSAKSAEAKTKTARKSKELDGVDALVDYADVWRWDIVGYVKSLTLRVHDAKSGNLLATGSWTDSALHRYLDAKTVVEGLVSETFAKLGSALQSASEPKSPISVQTPESYSVRAAVLSQPAVLSQGPEEPTVPVTNYQDSVSGLATGVELQSDTGVRVQVQRFDFMHSSTLPNEALRTLLADLIDIELTVPQLRAAALRVTEHYRSKGYPVRAVLPSQTLDHGIVKIIILESSALTQ